MHTKRTQKAFKHTRNHTPTHAHVRAHAHTNTNTHAHARAHTHTHTQAPLILEHDAELKLAKQLLKFPEVLKRLEGELYPNQLCDYLFETSQKFNQFYENCPVLGAETDELRASRTALCTATAQLLRLSLGLLGIGMLDRL